MPGRGLPARAVRGARLQRRGPRPEDLQRRGDPVETPVRRGDAAASRRPGGRPRPLHRGGGVDHRGRAARRLDLSAQRQSAGHREILHTKSNGWSGFLIIHSERLELEEPLVLAGDYNVIPTAPTCTIPSSGSSDALFLPQTRASFRALDQSRPDRRGPRHHRRSGGSTPSGTIRPAPGRRTTASASTICCSRRRRPTGSSTAGIDKHVRAWEKPSDHVPVWIELAIET